MRKLTRDAQRIREEADRQPERVAEMAGAIKERLSPAVESWPSLLAELLVQEVLKEHREKWKESQGQFDAPGEEQPLPEQQPRRGGPLRDDQGQKVVKPKGRLLTDQEAADYRGMFPTALVGWGWRITNRLPAISIGWAVRFDVQMVDRWIECHGEHPPRPLSEKDDERRIS